MGLFRTSLGLIFILSIVGCSATAETITPTPTPSTASNSAATPSATPSVTRPGGAKPSPQGNKITISVPEANIKKLQVIRYQGTPDDRAGTTIQNKGLAAAPYGTWGGVTPGSVGNFFITAHRNSAGSAMFEVPNLKPGNEVLVFYHNKTFVYTVTNRLWTNFRSAKSRATAQSSVPGKPNTVATKPYLVLSTCTTQEDFAAGNHWIDAFGNPTHRYNIVAVFKTTR